MYMCGVPMKELDQAERQKKTKKKRDKKKKERETLVPKILRRTWHGRIHPQVCRKVTLLQRRADVQMCNRGVV